MKTTQFKTNINCGGCIKAVTPFLNQVEGVTHWEVDTENENKILSVSSDNASSNDIIEAVKKAGFLIDPIG